MAILLESAVQPPLVLAPPDPAIRLDSVSVCYRLSPDRITSFKEYLIRRLRRQVNHHPFRALREVSLEIGRGHTVGIVGVNGAGKSTLLKVVARVLHPTEGRVRVRGRVAPMLELGVGFDYELTGRENAYLTGAILGRSRQEMDGRIEGIAAFAELGEFLDAPLRVYSTGMAARLGFAIATDVPPDILIIDEVLAVGDEAFQHKCLDRMAAFHEAGVTILFVSHDSALVRRMCDCAVWLEHGRVRATGPAAQVVAQYQSAGHG